MGDQKRVDDQLWIDISPFDGQEEGNGRGKGKGKGHEHWSW